MKAEVTVISHHFPTVEEPYLQPFIKDHIEALKLAGYRSEFIQIHPKMIPFTSRRKKYNSPLLTDIPTKKISYLSFPARMAPGFVSRQVNSALSKHINPHTNPFLHIHWLYPGGISIPGLKQQGYKCALTIHGSDWFLHKNDQRLRKYYLQAIRYADLVFTSGPRLKKDIQEEIDFDKEIICLYNYIDTTNFQPTNKNEKLELKKELNFSSKKIHVLSVSNIRHEKGIDVLLNAIHNTPDKLQFHIIGQQSNTPYAHKIKEMASALNQQEKRVVLHEPIPRDKLISYYRASEFYILASRSEGFNVSLLEAISCGLPVIASRTGGAEILIDQETGLLFNIEDVETLTKHINSMSSSFSSFDKNQLHEKIVSNYSLSSYSQILQKYYEEMLS